MVFDGARTPTARSRWRRSAGAASWRPAPASVLRFASAACLAGHLLSGATPPDQVARVRVVDFAQGEKLVDAESAHFLLSPNRKAPAGPSVPPSWPSRPTAWR
jgi:hypothetical protein